MISPIAPPTSIVSRRSRSDPTARCQCASRKRAACAFRKQPDAQPLKNMALFDHALSNQSFVGYTNIGHYLQRLVPTFSSATQVVLTGTSAGAFGAFLNYHRVAQAFCPKPTVLIDDSGPVMSDTYLAPC